MQSVPGFAIAHQQTRSSEFVRFVISGGIASATHLGILYGLTELTTLWYLPSTVIGFFCAFLVSFSLQKYWTFKEQGSERIRRQLLFYLILQLSALILNAAALYLIVETFGLWYLATQALLLIFIATVTFLLSKYLIFRNTIHIAHNNTTA